MKKWLMLFLGLSFVLMVPMAAFAQGETSNNQTQPAKPPWGEKGPLIEPDKDVVIDEGTPVTVIGVDDPPANSGGGDKEGNGGGKPGTDGKPGGEITIGIPEPKRPAFDDPSKAYPVHGFDPKEYLVVIELPGSNGRPGMDISADRSSGHSRDKSAPFRYDWRFVNETSGELYTDSSSGPRLYVANGFSVGSWKGTSLPWVMYHDYHWVMEEVQKSSTDATGEEGDLGRIIRYYKEYDGDPYPGPDYPEARYHFTVSTDEAGKPFTLPDDINIRKVIPVDELIR